MASNGDYTNGPQLVGNSIGMITQAFISTLINYVFMILIIAFITNHDKKHRLLLYVKGGNRNKCRIFTSKKIVV